MYSVRYISEKEQTNNNLLDIKDCVNNIEKMFRIMADNDYVMSGENQNSHGARLMFDRQGSINTNNLYISMPAHLGGEFNCTGIKWHGPNISGSSDTETKHTLIINDTDTGVPLCIMPANSITSYRTAAVSIYAAKRLANSNVKSVGIIGPGKINTLFLKGLAQEFPSIETIKIKGRGRNSIDKFVTMINSELDGIKEVLVVDSFEEAVCGADVVSINTGFEFSGIQDMPIIRDRWIKKGAVIICTAFVKFSDDFIVNKAVKVADNIKMYQSYAKELGHPVYRGLSNLGNRYIDLVHEGKICLENIFDLKDIASGRCKARKQEDDIVIFSSGGMAIEDLAVGYDVLKKAEKMNIGTILEW